MESISWVMALISALDSCARSSDLAPRVPRPVGEEEEDRHHEEGERGELPAEDQHRHQGVGDSDHVGDDRGGGVGHHRLDSADVVGEAGLDLPGSGGGEEAHREPLEVGVQGVAPGPPSAAGRCC